MKKSDQIIKLTDDMLETAIPEIKKLIRKAVNSGAIDVEGWDRQFNPMIIPKCILIAALETEADQYRATGTVYEKQVEKEVRNLKNFI